MEFDSVTAFFEMGGYGFFVWLAFGVSFLAMLVIYFESIIAKRKLFSFAQQEFARKQRIKAVRKKQDSQVAEDQAVTQEVTQ